MFVPNISLCPYSSDQASSSLMRRTDQPAVVRNEMSMSCYAYFHAAGREFEISSVKTRFGVRKMTSTSNVRWSNENVRSNEMWWKPLKMGWNSHEIKWKPYTPTISIIAISIINGLYFISGGFYWNYVISYFLIN